MLLGTEPPNLFYSFVLQVVVLVFAVVVGIAVYGMLGSKTKPKK